MNPRHAAALALAGWYLMIPPTGCSGHPNPKAPLSEWAVVWTSDEVNTCLIIRDGLKHPTPDTAVDPKRLLTDAGYQGSVTAVENAQCIATDDPRLARP